MGAKIDTKSLQKTCHIYTVNLGHISKELKGNSEEDILVALREHHAIVCSFPNVKLVRAQIERNSDGVLHVNGGVKLSKPIRARTLENKLGGWFDPAINEDAVMNYGRKQETRVELLPNFGEKKVNRSKVSNPKQEAIAMLIDGMNPAEICLKRPDVYFTHHRAIVETWKMMQTANQMRRLDEPKYGDEEE